MRENKIEAELKKQVKIRGGLCIKLVTTFFAGLPDRLVLLPNGVICFVETKATGLDARKLQKSVHKSLQNLGFLVYVVDNYDTISPILDKLIQNKAR